MTLLNYCAEDQCLEVLFCFGISGQVSRSFFRILNRSASTSALRGVSMLRQAICSPDADHFFLSMSYRNYSKANRSVVSITVQSRLHHASLPCCFPFSRSEYEVIHDNIYHHDDQAYLHRLTSCHGHHGLCRWSTAGASYLPIIISINQDTKDRFFPSSSNGRCRD